MASRYRFLLLLILVLSLAGCFRQASDPVDVDPIVVPDTNPTVPPGNVNPTNTPGQLPPATNTLPVLVITSTPVEMTVQAPTNVPPPTQVPQDTNVPQVIPPSETPVDGSVVQPQPMVTSSATPQFVTPGANPNDTAVTTPTPTVQIVTATPLVTPTDIGDTGPVALGDDCIYVVQGGDTLFRIALSYNLTLAEVVAVNPGIVPELIQPDDEILIPDCGEITVEGPVATEVDQDVLDGNVHVVVSGDTLLGIARQYGVSSDALIAANNLTDPNALQVGQRLIIPAADFEPGDEVPDPNVEVVPTQSLNVIHVVQDGDTLIGIATQYGILAIDIINANPGQNLTTLSIGQEIIIPPVQP